MTNLRNRRILVLGAGRSGRAAAALAAREGAAVTLADTATGARADALRDGLADLAAQGVGMLFGADAAPGGIFDLGVLSPGIPGFTGWGREMLAHCHEVVGETEFAVRFFAGRIVGITGTNGKTTTTEMIACAMRGAGRRALAAGNIGLPLSEVVTNHPDTEMVALELSSFQLETISTLHPDVAVWLNFAPDHLDWYATLDDYRAAKERIFLNIGPQDTAVVPPEMIETAAARGPRLRLFDVDDPTAHFHISLGSIIRDGRTLSPLSAFALRGRHNHANLLAALAAAEAIGLPDDAVLAALAAYQPPAHRFQFVATCAAGVDFINDSKSTNLHSLASALDAEARPVVLLAGGKEKGLDFQELRAQVADRCRAVIAFGEIRGHLAQAWDGAAPVIQCEHLADALETARDHAQPGDLVLLSPGTSSFDQFRDYIDRGESFARLVRESIARRP